MDHDDDPLEFDYAREVTLPKWAGRVRRAWWDAKFSASQCWFAVTEWCWSTFAPKSYARDMDRRLEKFRSAFKSLRYHAIQHEEDRLINGEPNVGIYSRPMTDTQQAEIVEKLRRQRGLTE